MKRHEVETTTDIDYFYSKYLTKCEYVVLESKEFMSKTEVDEWCAINELKYILEKKTHHKLGPFGKFNKNMPANHKKNIELEELKHLKHIYNTAMGITS